MDRQTIYIAAYVKSGSTWLTRLLADILDSPSGGCMPSEDKKEVATEGQDRPGPYIVRKGHFVLIDDDTGPVVPRPHRLAWRQLTSEKIVFLVRDPRDICVSGAWHWNKSTGQKAIEQFMGRMFRGNVAKCGRWDEYCDKWLDLSIPLSAPIAKYERLSAQISVVINALGLNYEFNKMVKAIERQSFSNRKSQTGDNPQELRRNNMRKGIAGDWKNHFTPQMNDRMWSEFGWMMEKLGYAQD